MTLKTQGIAVLFSVFVVIALSLVLPVYAEFPSPHQQIENGVDLHDIQCNTDRVHAIRSNENHVCVTQKSAERMNWQIILDDSMPYMQVVGQEPKQEIETGFTTISLKEDFDGWIGISHFCAGWPKDFSVTFPNVVEVGQEFNVTIGYTYLIYDQGDIDESLETGEPLIPEDAEERLGSARGICNDPRVYVLTNEKLSLITKGVFHENQTNDKTGRVESVHHVDYPFNNTVKQTQDITFKYDNLPDRYDQELWLNFIGNKPSLMIEHFVDDNGILYLLANKSCDRCIVETTGHAFVAQSRSIDVENSDFYTRHIPLPPQPAPFTPVNDTRPMPFEALAEAVTVLNIYNVIDWIRTELNYSQSYIDEFAEKFPDLAARFISFLDFDIPSAYAQSPQLVYVYGHFTYQDSPTNIKLDGALVCAFDRDTDTGVASDDVAVNYGNSPACDDTDANGFYRIAMPKSDTNDSGSVDLVLYVYPNSKYFDFVGNYTSATGTGDKITLGLYYPNAIGDSNLASASGNIRNDTHLVDSIKLAHIMQETARHIDNTYDYELPKVIVSYDENECEGTGYTPGDNKLISLDHRVQPLFCNTVHFMHDSDTPKHEVYHYYNDLIYTVKNNGNLPDTSDWVPGHKPTLTLPESQAWIEGIASAFVLLEKDSHLYTSVSNTNQFNYEVGYVTLPNGTTVYFAEGPTSEGAVTQFIWDLVDSTPNEVGDDANKTDTVSVSDSTVNDVFDDPLNNEQIVAETVLNFVDDWEDTELVDISNILLLNAIIDELPVVTTDEFLGNVIFEDDFDTNLSKWTLNGDEDWEIGRWVVAQPPFATGSILEQILYQVGRSNNCDDYCHMTQKNPLSLSSYDKLYLNFWYFVDESVDLKTPDNEGLKVEIYDGSDWNEIFYWYKDNGNTNNWQEIKNHDISSYAGNSFKIRFTAISSSNSEDMQIANLQIRGVPSSDNSDGDGGGNSDNTPPVITLNDPISMDLEHNATYVDPGYSAIDNVDGNITSSVVVSGEVNFTALTTYFLNYDVSDVAGNAAQTITRIVNVVDTTPPVIAVPPNAVFEATGVLTRLNSNDYGNAAVTDNYDQSITVANNATSIFPLGNTTINWTATDDAGNSANATQTITIQDTTAPAITIPDDVTVEATGIITSLGVADYGTATATDLADANPTITNDAPTSFPLGDTVITWTATDGTGNSATATQTVTVRDTVPPSITPLPFGVYVSVGADAPSAIDFEVPDVTDAVDAAVTASCTPAPGSLLSPGVTVVMCTASDASGNSASMSFTLNVNLSYAHSPQILSADVTDSAVVLDWYRPTFGGDVTGYQVLRSNATTTDMAVIWQGVSTSFVDYTVLPDTEYTYHAISVNGTRISSPSNTVTVTTDPAGLIGLMAVSTDGAVTLTWNDVPGADRYVVRKSVAVDSLISRYAWFLGGDILTVTDHSVSAGETFVYHVVADDRTDYHDYLHYDFVEVRVE